MWQQLKMTDKFIHFFLQLKGKLIGVNGYVWLPFYTYVDDVSIWYLPEVNLYQYGCLLDSDCFCARLLSGINHYFQDGPFTPGNFVLIVVCCSPWWDLWVVNRLLYSHIRAHDMGLRQLWESLMRLSIGVWRKKTTKQKAN